MPKQEFSRINVKAALVTGAVMGFLCWVFAAPLWIFGYGITAMAHFQRTSYVTSGMSYGLGLVSVFLCIIIGAVAGALIGLIYNWALKLK